MTDDDKVKYANEIVARLEKTGRTIIAALADAQRIPCPVCGNDRLEISPSNQHLIFECSAPVHHMCEEGGPFCVVPCGFRLIVSPTSIHELPAFPDYSFKPKRARKKKVDEKSD